MAMLFVDSMDLYSSRTNMQAAGWAIGDNSRVEVLTSGGRFGGGCVEVEYQNLGLSRSIIMTGSTLIAQFAFKHNKLSDATTRSFVEFFNNSGTELCGRLRVTTIGSVKAYDSSDSLVEESSAGVISENVWQYCEVKIVIGDTGSLTVKINGTQVINATSIDTKPGTPTDVDKISFQGASDDLAIGIFYDDFLIMDGSGSLNNDFIGDKAITVLQPNSDDATDAAWLSQPSQSAGSEYLNIDDPEPGTDDGDSSYNYSNTPADDSLYGFENLAGTPANISAVQLTLSAKKSDGGSRSVKHLFKGDTKIAEAAFNPGTSYELHRVIREQSADASPVAWTAAKVNALLAGMRLES